MYKSIAHVLPRIQRLTARVVDRSLKEGVISCSRSSQCNSFSFSLSLTSFRLFFLDKLSALLHFIAASLTSN
jgi:hypothetical protein